MVDMMNNGRFVKVEPIRGTVRSIFSTGTIMWGT